jgi:hypothetical protein
MRLSIFHFTSLRPNDTVDMDMDLDLGADHGFTQIQATQKTWYSKHSGQHGKVSQVLNY